jgi:hypothetical protein
MSLTMQESAKFRTPSTLPGTPAPKEATLDTTQVDYFGDWYLVRTSNSFWKDKSDVRMHYAASGEDHFAYTPAQSTVEKRMEGRNVPEPKTPGAYSWVGKGLMRLFTVHWEILGFEERPEKMGWLLSFQHKTIFTAPAVNIACRSKNGPDEETVGMIKDWLKSLGDDGLSKAADDIDVIDHRA